MNLRLTREIHVNKITRAILKNVNLSVYEFLALDGTRAALGDCNKIHDERLKVKNH